MKLKSYFFSYSDRYRSGSFDIRNVVRWESDGQAYYLKYSIYFKDGSKCLLEPDEFRRFENQFNTLEENVNET